MLWIGVDVGGTFTDGVVYDDETKKFRFEKSSSTPKDPVLAVTDVIDLLGLDLSSVGRFAHGITIGTNAVLEKKGASVWLLTTKGFRDVLDIARTNRHELYNIRTQKIPPILPRTRSLEIDERMNADGSVLRALDEDEVRRTLKPLAGLPPSGLVIGFLHSYINRSHEEKAAAVAAEMLPGWYICTSSQVLPQYREYERLSTAALNAYIGPITAGYLTRLGANLKEKGYGERVYIMTSNGGVATAERAKIIPVGTILSGPAGGVAAAVDLGRRTGIRNLITCDMGGTSTDVCLLENLQPQITNHQFIGGYVNRTPHIAINAVGAGGGSIAWLDIGDILNVGPQSAGADPGPACYDRGGTEPTITDANLVLNRLAPDIKLAGRMALRRDLAFAAVERLAHKLKGLDPYHLSEGIIQIAVARMVSAIKEISMAEGRDPRDFALLAFGGAGPMHACAIAEELEQDLVVIPVGPGNFCALGSLISDLRRDYTQNRTMLLEAVEFEDIKTVFAEMEAVGLKDLNGEGVGETSISFVHALGMRYLGQSWDMEVTLAPEISSIAQLESAFAEAHTRRFGHKSDGRVEIVEFRLASFGRVPTPDLTAVVTQDEAEDQLPRRQIYFAGEFIDTPSYRRSQLIGHFEGPAVIEEQGSTTIVLPHWSGAVLPSGEILLKRSARQ